jgi:hypothetical protein
MKQENIQKELHHLIPLVDRKKDDYRTVEENSVFSEIALITGNTKGVKTEKTDKNIRFSNWVGTTGFEPVTLCL